MESTHFKDCIERDGTIVKYELACPCCGVNNVDRVSLQRLEQFREYYGSPVTLNSAYRCPEHNKEVGSKDTSSHPKGHAFDIRVRNSSERDRMINAAQKAGFYRKGISANFLHIDDDPVKVQHVMWVYS